jgi:hypothetical protein
MGADLYLVPRADWNRLKLGERWFGLAADGESREEFLGELRRFRYERSRTPVTVKIEPKAWVFVLARDGKLGMAEVAAPASHLEDVVIDLR